MSGTAINVPSRVIVLEAWINQRFVGGVASHRVESVDQKYRTVGVGHELVCDEASLSQDPNPDRSCRDPVSYPRARSCWSDRLVTAVS